MATKWHLSLAFACTCVFQGDSITKVKGTYQDFLMLWKDADPDIPALKQAEADYAKLQ